MRFICVFKHGSSQRPPTEAEGAGMFKLIEEGMKAGWLLGIDGVDDDITGVRVNKDPDAKSRSLTVFCGDKRDSRRYALLQRCEQKKKLSNTRGVYLSTVYQAIGRFIQLYG